MDSARDEHRSHRAKPTSSGLSLDSHRLVEAFQRLRLPRTTSKGVLVVSTSAIPGWGAHRIGKDAAGGALILLKSVESKNASPPAIGLQNLSIAHGIRCRMFQGRKRVDDGYYSVLRCTAGDPTVVGLFLRFCAPLVDVLGRRPTQDDISRLAQDLVQLFRALSSAPRKSVQGLWAELLLIANSDQPRFAMEAWHADPTERYDFSLGAARLEVKSVAGMVREHHFSMEQVTPPTGVTALIASMRTERTGGGTSLETLAGTIRKRIEGEPQLLLRLETVLAATLGANLTQGLAERFDLHVAIDSLRFFQAPAIPRPSEPIPRQVRGIHFISDLTNVESVDLQHGFADSQLFVAIQPAQRAFGETPQVRTRKGGTRIPS